MEGNSRLTPTARGRDGERVVVPGAGFGGLTYCQNFSFPGADVTVVDRRTYKHGARIIVGDAN